MYFLQGDSVLLEDTAVVQDGLGSAPDSVSVTITNSENVAVITNAPVTINPDTGKWQYIFQSVIATHPKGVYTARFSAVDGVYTALDEVTFHLI
jgi:hypothetical protein